MKRFVTTCGLLCAAGVLSVLSAASAEAAFMEFAHVGNAGNGPDPAGYNFGAVPYEYGIGKLPVTQAQYVEFLNAVAASDPYGLFGPQGMHLYGIAITRSGAAGSYTYSVAPEAVNRPVGYISWGSAARFANWMTNGTPTGALTGTPALDGWLTESGSYVMNGATSRAALIAVDRIDFGDLEPDKKYYFLPTMDEWHKAAYHKNDGVTGNYYLFPTQSDTGPVAELPPGGANSANFNWLLGGRDNGAVNHFTDVGAYAGTFSPYGAFDMAGSVWEWTERIGNKRRSLNGGAISVTNVDHLRSDFFRAAYPEVYLPDYGFRLVVVPEPATMLMLASGLAGVWGLRRRPHIR